MREERRRQEGWDARADPEGRRRNRRGYRTSRVKRARHATSTPGTRLRCSSRRCVRRENMLPAYQRVVRNGGAPGVDGMTVDELMPYCREHWARIREELLSGTYRPAAGAAGGDPEAGRQRHADAGHSDGAGPTDPAGPAPGAAAASSTRRSRTRASASGRDAARTRRSSAPASTSRPGIGGWWTWTWRSSSTGSTTTC